VFSGSGPPRDPISKSDHDRAHDRAQASKPASQQASQQASKPASQPASQPANYTKHVVQGSILWELHKSVGAPDLS